MTRSRGRGKHNSSQWSWPCWRPSFGQTRHGQEVETRTTRHRNITSSEAPGFAFSPALAFHYILLCVTHLFTRFQFTITALVESQHTSSSSYTIDNSPSYSAFRLRKPLGRRACRILQLSDDKKSVRFKFVKDERQITWSPSWPKLTRSWSLKFYFFFQQWASQR